MVLETVGSSKSNNIRSLLIQAWRDRWSDVQWGIHIKTVLPRYISGDIYHLSDCILQQALMGPLPNQLILSYLRHSLAAHVVSYGGVIESISKYESLHKAHCVRALLELLSNMASKLTCRGKPEDCLALATALVAGVKWLLKVTLYAAGKISSADQVNNLKKSVSLLQEYLQCPFLMSLLHIARLEEPVVWSQLLVVVTELETKHGSGGTLMEYKESLPKIFVDLRSNSYLKTVEPSTKHDPKVTPVCYGLHARVLVEAVLHSTQTSQSLATQLLLYKQLKGLSEKDLYLELLVTCFLGLGSEEENAHQKLHWVGFTFIKVPSIIQQINANLHGSTISSSSQSPSTALLTAVQQLGSRIPLLDVADNKMNCNCLEFLLHELTIRTSLLLESDKCAIINNRQEDPQAVCVGASPAAKEAGTAQIALPNLILRAQPTVSSILKTLSNKNQESVLPVMNLLISGKSRDLLLTAAAASGKLYIYAQKFVKFNQQSLEPQPGESEIMAKSRALMFDITFLLLCHIAQVYGIDVVAGEETETFVETWMRSHMPETARVKMVTPHCRSDTTGLMEVMKQVNAVDMSAKYGQAYWDKVCRASPQIMQKLMSEVLSGTVTLTTATELLDRMCSHLCSLAIYFTAWTCSFLHEVTGEKATKVRAILSHLQQKLSNQEPTLSLGSFKDRSMLMSEIIDNMVKVTKETYFINNQKEQEPRTYNFYANLLNSVPGNNTVALEDPNSTDNQLDTLLTETWDKVFRKSGVMTHKGLWRFQCLLRLGGHRWFVTNLVELAMQNVFEADLNRAMDLVYGIFQIDQLECCTTLLTQCVPSYFGEPGSSALHSYRRIGALARLIVQVLVAAWTEQQSNSQTMTGTSASSPPNISRGQKRSFSIMTGEEAEELLVRRVHSLKVDQSALHGTANGAVSIMVVMKIFLSKLCLAVPRGLVSPVSELVVAILQELVVAPTVLTPLITLLPPKLLPIILVLHPPVTFTPCHLLALALPQTPANSLSPLSPAMEATARRSAAKLLCTHRNFVLAAESEYQAVLG